jgi:putative transposase
LIAVARVSKAGRGAIDHLIGAVTVGVVLEKGVRFIFLTQYQAYCLRHASSPPIVVCRPASQAVPAPASGYIRMARSPRLDVPGIPQHVIQRGNNRQVCFAADEDYTAYRHDLLDAATHCRCAIHAYVLMTNHVHLLVTGTEPGSVSRMMQRLGRRYVACFNARYRRTGTLWEGRFKASLVDTHRYLLTCYRYIELNPVRAAMVAHPRGYRWSSFHCNALGQADPLITPHPVYLAIDAMPDARRAAYRDLFKSAISEDDMAKIRAHIQQQKALGDSRFQAHIEALLARNVSLRPHGRPKLPPRDSERATPEQPPLLR